MAEAQTTCCEEARSAGSAGDPAAPSCPMAAVCREFTESTVARYGCFVLGALFIVLGVAILLVPELLVWLAGGTTILLGVLALVGGIVVRRLSARLECCGPSSLEARSEDRLAPV